MSHWPYLDDNDEWYDDMKTTLLELVVTKAPDNPKKKQFGEWTVKDSLPSELQIQMVRWGNTEWRTLLPKVMTKVPKGEKYHLQDGYYVQNTWQNGRYVFTKEEPPKIPGVDIPLWDKQYDVEPIASEDHMKKMYKNQ